MYRKKPSDSIVDEAVLEFQNAILSENVDLVRGYLLTNPEWINKDITTPDGNVCPLYFAIKASLVTKRTDMVRLLLESGADLKSCSMCYYNVMGYCPLTHAARLGSADAPVLDILLEHTVFDERKECRISYGAMFHAARRGDLDLVKKLIEKGFNVNWSCENVNRAIHTASYSGHIDVVRFLLSKGADVTANNTKTSPLHLAVRYNHIDIVKLLLDHGSDVNEGNSTRFSPLMMACSCDLVDIVKVLLERGADVNNQRTASSPFHFSPLSIAAFHGKSEIVSLLIKYGADVNIGNECAITPLHIVTNAVETPDSIRTVEVMIESGANMNKLDSLGRSALIYSLSKGRETIAGVLIKYGASLEPQETFDPLYFAFTTPCVSERTMEIILQSGYDIAQHGQWLKLSLLNDRMVMWEIETDRTEYEERKKKYEWLKCYLTRVCSLQELCRIEIRKSLVKHCQGLNIFPAVSKLPITQPAKTFLSFGVR